MIRDITIGQYYPADSVVHILDPRTKLNGTMIFIISLFLFSVDTAVGFFLPAVILGLVISASKIPFKYILKGLKAVIFILLFTVIFNMFLTPGDTEIFRFKFIRITDKGLLSAVSMGGRLVLLIIGSSLMTFTTTPNQLTDGLESLLGPLKKLKVPVHDIAMMMSIALRFIPILLDETDKIMKAQQARGADFESGNVLRRVKAMVPILVPLFVSAFRRAYDLAAAMEARCYNSSAKRTKMKPLKYTKSDYVAYVLFVIYIVAIVFTKNMIKRYL